MNFFLCAALVMLVGYILGSLSFAVMVARMKGVNIFEVGSGNPGATNVLRSLGKGAGYTVFALDFLKGFVAAYWTRFLPDSTEPSWDEWLPILGLATAILGHSFSIFLKFKGGKGVATTVGGILALQPFVILVGIGVWVITFYSTRFVSLASILLGVSLPVSAWVLTGSSSIFWFCLLLAVLIVARHKSNIVRIVNGTENRFSRKKD